MRAVSTSQGGFRHSISVGEHTLSADEPTDKGGENSGPSPEALLAASLASCTAITMQMYAQRKGWDLPGLEVAVDFTPAERGTPTCFQLDLTLPDSLTDEQAGKLATIAAKCPIHRALEGEAMFTERVIRRAAA